MSGSRLWLALPAVLLVGAVALLLWWRPLDQLAASAPPVEEAAVESVRLTPGLISLTLRTDGSEPVTVAQVQVDGAYRTFTIAPDRPSARLGLVRIEVPYPWIAGEAHHIALVTRTGVVFEHTIDVAEATPVLSAPSLLLLAGVGTLLGIVPVAIGLLTWPAMRTMSPRGVDFLLALTVGFLAFLLIETIGEGLENASDTVGRLRGTALFWVVFALAAVALLVLGRRQGRAPEGMALAMFIAVGIGLHNLGEGLAVGAALATGSAALATFLVIGFTIHNVTEGIGIAAPLAREQPPLLRFVLLAAIAGLPAIAGTILGTQAPGPLWTAVCFAVGGGAILQVIIEVTALILRRGPEARLTDPALAGGASTGLLLMYVTALLV
jgi:zinc transporter ZupT